MCITRHNGEFSVDKSGFRLSDVLIAPTASLRDCLSCIDKYGFDYVFVVDSSNRLIGTVRESEIRKALVQGVGLFSPVERVMGTPAALARPSDSRAEVLDLMRALRVKELPVVEHDGRVVGVHVDHGTLGMTARDNWAVIIAGGKGTRLAPLTNDIPKPMLPIAGRPILERLVLHLAGAGIARILLSVNYLGHMIQDHFGDGSAFGCEIEYLWEEQGQPLGTGGPLGLLRDLGFRPAHPLLVMNGDLVTGFSVPDLLDAHAAQDVVATIAVSEYQHQVPFGVLESHDQRLVRIVEKPMPSWPVSSGIYVIEPSLLSRVPTGEHFPITELFEECLKRDEPIGLWPMNDPWQDIGRPDELAKARGQL